MHHDYSILAYEMKGKPLPELNWGAAPPALEGMKRKYVLTAKVMKTVKN